MAGDGGATRSGTTSGKGGVVDLSLDRYMATERRNSRTLPDAEGPGRFSAPASSAADRCITSHLGEAQLGETDLVEPCVKSLRKLPDGSVDYNYAFVRLMCSPDGMALVRVAGEIDFNTAPKLSVAVDDALNEGACSIFIDLAEVTFFGSAGAMELLVARRDCQRRGAEFVLLRPSRPALRVLAFTDLVRPLIDLRDHRWPGGGPRSF